MRPPTGDHEPTSRREFLRRTGTVVAASGLGLGCTQDPPEHVVPAARAPERSPAGTPLHFATCLPGPGGGLGVIVESFAGRPIKVEGNPDHPASRGGTDVFAQAATMDLYDAERIHEVTRDGRPVGADEFAALVLREHDAAAAGRGRGLAILAPPTRSPTLLAWSRRLRREWPEARWYEAEPETERRAREASLAALGADVRVELDFERIDVLVSLAGRFLDEGPSFPAVARAFAARRARSSLTLFAAEPAPSLTGAQADRRLAIDPAGLTRLARALEARLSGAARPTGAGEVEEFLAAVVAAIEAAPGRAAVVAGPDATVETQAIAHRIDAIVSGDGGPSRRRPVLRDAPDGTLLALAASAAAGEVRTLVVLGGLNPVYAAPGDVNFADVLARVPTSIRLGDRADETAAAARWSVPRAHALESWSDDRASDGTVAVLQPLIRPLFGGLTDVELLAWLLGGARRPAEALVREHWRERIGGGFEERWHEALRRGVLEPAKPEDEAIAPPPPSRTSPPVAPRDAESSPDGDRVLALIVRADPRVGDGTYAHVDWLQELPKPLTSRTWGNAFELAPEEAARRGLEDGDVVRVRRGDVEVEGPVQCVPGTAAACVVAHLGYGRRRGAGAADGLGFDAWRLVRSGDDAAVPVTMRPTGDRVELLLTQEHHRMEGREFVVPVSGRQESVPPRSGRPESTPAPLRTPPVHGGHQWGMVIDLAACIGCGVCTIACQAENNVPAVGPDEVSKGREMHWIRVDTWFEGFEPTGGSRAPDRPPRILHQPVPCMHCENAPCELVCPVQATVHDREGRNEMIYNRCVGTRYCSNDCPYKVRRFNYFEYARPVGSEVLGLNPDVTVRSRGVMEKCTYCVQRIERARIDARLEHRALRSSDVRPACGQACPTEAIVFGDLNEPSSAVARARRDPRHDALLAELNTRPRTTYLAPVFRDVATPEGGR